MTMWLSGLDWRAAAVAGVLWALGVAALLGLAYLASRGGDGRTQA